MNDDRSGTIIDIVVYLLLAAGGVWLIVRFGASAGLVRSILHGVGYVLAGQGILMAVREFRRLFEPDVVAALEAEEAEREKRARLVGLAAWTTRSWWRRRACETVSDGRKTHEQRDPATV